MAAIGGVLEGVAQEKAVALVTHVVRPVHPILIRNEHGPLLRVVVDVPKGQAVRAASLVISLDGTDDLTDLAELRLFATGAQEAFSSASPIGEAVDPAMTMTLPVDRELAEGKNVFWLSCRLKDSAELSHQVAASCTSIVTSVGKIRPRDDVVNARQRIGVALRRHNDDGVHTYRIPALTTSVRGTLLAVYACSQKPQPRWKVFGSLICKGLGNEKLSRSRWDFGESSAGSAELWVIG